MLEKFDQFKIENPNYLYGGSIVEEDAEGF